MNLLNFIVTLQTLITPEEEQAIMRLAANYRIAVAFAAVGIVGLVAVCAMWFVYEHWLTPQESKEFRKSARAKRPIIALAGDDGYCDFKEAPFSGPEGILQTKKVGRTQDHYTGALPRPREFEEKDIQLADANADLKKTVAMANYISMLANRRLLLRGSKIPVWFAYRGKAVITSIYGLAALQILESLKETKDDALKKISEILTPIDLIAVKALFAEQWNESQINAQETDAEQKGFLRARKFGGKESLILIFALMILLVVVLIIALVAAYYFSK